MKKVMTILGTIIIASALLTSCGGGSIEKDAKEIAEIQCKAQQLIKKSTSGDMSLIEESTKLALESCFKPHQFNIVFDVYFTSIYYTFLEYRQYK